MSTTTPNQTSAPPSNNVVAGTAGSSTSTSTTSTSTITATGPRILTVGAGQEYATIQAAVAASQAGDEIDIMAGTYVASDVTLTHDLTIKGVGGAVDVQAPSQLTYGENVDKGIFVSGTEGNTPNVTIEGLTLTGAYNSDYNAAGIRYQSGNLTLINDTIADNQDGILASPFVNNTGTVIEQGITLDHNGSTSGLAHNQYIDEINTFIMVNSVSEDAILGHEVKSRAFNSIIVDNVIQDTATGTASYAIDLPNGGNAIVQANTIEKGPSSQSSVMIHYGGPQEINPGSLIVGNNVLIDDYSKPGSLIPVWNQTLSTDVTVTGNTFKDNTSTTVLSGPGTQAGNVATNGTVLASSISTLPSAVSTTVSYSAFATAQNYTFHGSGFTVIGGAGLLTVPNGGNGDIVVGGSGGINFTGFGGMVYTAAHSSNTLTLTGGVAVQSAGNDTIVVQGNNASVTMDGTATVTDSTSGAVIFFVRGDVAVHESGLSNESMSVLSGGTVTETGATKMQNISDQGGTFAFNTGTNAGSFSGYVHGSSVSAKTVSLTTWQNPFMANSITATAGNYSLALDGGGSVDAHADSGTINITNANAPMSFIGGSGSTTINTGSVTAHIVMGSGITSVTGLKTAPASTYEVDLGTSNGGTMTINDFKPGVDHLVLGAGVTIASQAFVSNALHIDTSNNAHVILPWLHSL